MIQHLNPVHFQLFGAILPERRHGSPAPDYTDGWQTLRLTTADAPVYLAEADTLLTADSGITILSVSEDGESFLDFYLDKPVKLNGGIRYCLTALRGTSSAAIRAQEGEMVFQMQDLVFHNGPLLCLICFHSSGIRENMQANFTRRQRNRLQNRHLSSQDRKCATEDTFL